MFLFTCFLHYFCNNNPDLLSWLNTRFWTSVTWRVPWVEEKLFTIPVHLNSQRLNLVFCVVFRRIFIVGLSVFDLLVCLSYYFWLHFWYLQLFLHTLMWLLCKGPWLISDSSSAGYWNFEYFMCKVRCWTLSIVASYRLLKPNGKPDNKLVWKMIWFY